ncbi:MAG: tRNA (adenosine(37)-N6)-dimethylallyltransferase MiaA [Paracoccaceae bacterium]
MQFSIDNISSELPILIAGPTASGKSALALELAARHGRIIINADALQVYSNWRILTARPSDADLLQAPHHLYGHIEGDVAYSVGQWLREVTCLLSGSAPVIIVGGTGLYFAALTEGLANIPPTPQDIRTLADERLTSAGVAALLAELDVETLARIDQLNPVRVQRAWEVQKSTQRGLAAWQDDTPEPLVPLKSANAIVLCAEKDWLNDRIVRRFDAMLADGALAEAESNLNSWSPSLPSAKAIGAAELIAHLKGDMTLEQARDSATTATRQFAKRQRSWFRKRMARWQHVTLP